MGQSIRTVHADFRDALPRLVDPGTVTAVVCMGDTMPHLPNRADVRQLITDVAGALHPGGSFVVTYRDLSGNGAAWTASFRSARPTTGYSLVFSTTSMRAR